MSRRTRDEDFDTKIDILRTRLKDSDDKNVQDAVFDKRTLMDLYGLASKGVIDALGGSVCTGKEANIFRARAGEKELALKIYRISTSNFNSMQDYLQGDPRFSSVRGTKRAIVAAWTRKEFRNLSRAEEVGIPVPHPIAMKENILVMDLVAVDGQAAPTLKEVDLKQEEARAVYERIVDYISQLYNRAQLVHADLSEFNILYHQGRPVIIDMGQSVTLDHPQARRFLERDIANVAHFFRKRYGIGSPEEIWNKLINDKDEMKEEKAD
ncbi:MAG TPA: serine protein kinase RIO [Methanothrix sp.]|jgi:RIO kinase 1|nr:serine protein kinase RIO [Methanothrix sp.]HOU71061.1 serine protein kinase RIO [Methanothrix sp.]HQE97894.1 serine protein kinase RIO [Methanothrix sp.]HQJ80249.1 serine protein kinase RIO [Methanothrix sp.]HUM81854.1 serine protein kinase RIO [Methanothrix sp.]